MGDVRNDTDKYTCASGYTYIGSTSNATVACYPTNTTYTAYSDYLNVSVAGTSSAAYVASGQAVTGVGKFGAKLGLIVTVVIAAVIIGVLVRYLWVR